MNDSFFPFVIFMFLLTVIFILVILYVRIPAKGTLPLKELRARSNIMKLNEYHYRVLSRLADCLNLSEESFENLNMEVLELKGVQKDLEETQYTISYFHLVNRIIILLMNADFKLTEEEFLYVASLFQIMGNFLPLINQENV